MNKVFPSFQKHDIFADIASGRRFNGKNLQEVR